MQQVKFVLMKLYKWLPYIVPSILLATPLVLFVCRFGDLKLSNDPEGWESFAAYFGGTVGTVGSIIVGFFVYKAFALQNKQRIEGTLFSYLNSAIEIRNEIRKKLIEQERLLHETIKTEIAKTPEIDQSKIKSLYFDYLEKYFIERYSWNTPTPRLIIELNMYFKFVNSLCYLIHDSHLDEKLFNQLRTFLISQFHDSEIKMICYYAYLFYDVVNSSDSKFKSINIIKTSKLFGDNLYFSDDFSRNLDPRGKDFEIQLNQYKAKIKALRTPKVH